MIFYLFLTAHLKFLQIYMYVYKSLCDIKFRTIFVQKIEKIENNKLCNLL